MFKYYIRIFYKKNTPYSFNWSVIFPFLGTILSTLSIIIIYCVMNSMENHIKKAVISIDGNASIRIKDKKGIDYDNTLNSIQKYLNDNEIDNQRVISRAAWLNFKNENIFVNVVGFEDISYLEKAFDLSISSADFKNSILIGERLAYKIGGVEYKDSIRILSPLDSGFFISGKQFRCLDQKIDFNNPNSIKNISENYVFIDYDSAKEIFGLAKPYINVYSQLNNQTLSYMKNKFQNIYIDTWESANPIFFNAIKIEKMLYSGFGVVILLIVGFNIYGLINLIILRKKNQLSLMTYIGASKKELRLLFNYNILIIGILGTLIGVALSLYILNSDFLIDQGFLPMLTEIDIYYPIIYFSIIFNLLVLYFSSRISVSENIKNIGALKSNAIES